MKGIIIFLFFQLIVLKNCAINKYNSPKDIYIYTQIKDHLTHESLDTTITVRLLTLSDSCLDGAASVFTREIDGKVITNALAYINQPGQYILRIEAVNYNTKDIIVDIPKIYKREKYRELPITYMHRKQQKNEIELDEILVKATKLKFYFIRSV